MKINFDWYSPIGADKDAIEKEITSYLIEYQGDVAFKNYPVINIVLNSEAYKPPFKVYGLATDKEGNKILTVTTSDDGSNPSYAPLV